MYALNVPFQAARSICMHSYLPLQRKTEKQSATFVEINSLFLDFLLTDCNFCGSFNSVVLTIFQMCRITGATTILRTPKNIIQNATIHKHKHTHTHGVTHYYYNYTIRIQTDGTTKRTFQEARTQFVLFVCVT